jgi:hypothetical protein
MSERRAPAREAATKERGSENMGQTGLNAPSRAGGGTSTSGQAMEPHPRSPNFVQWCYERQRKWWGFV